MKQISAHFVIDCYFGKSLSSTTTVDDRISKYRVKYENNSLVWISNLDIFCFPRGTELLRDQPCSYIVGDSCFFQFRDEADFFSLKIYKGNTGDKGDIEALYSIYCGIIISNRPMENVFE